MEEPEIYETKQKNVSKMAGYLLFERMDRWKEEIKHEKLFLKEGKNEKYQWLPWVFSCLFLVFAYKIFT